MHICSITERKLRAFMALVALSSALTGGALAMPLNAVSLESNFRAAEEVSGQEVQQALKPYLGREITADLLEDVLAEVSRYYRTHGHGMARAFCPEQTLSHGVLSVYVHDPVIRGVSPEDEGVLTEGAKERLFKRVREADGKPLSSGEMENALLRLADLGTLDLKGELDDRSLDPALTVRVSEALPHELTLFADNHGTKASGEYRFGGMARLGNLTGNADLLSLFYARSSHRQNNYSAAYVFPVNSAPTRLGVSVCLSDYELGREYEDLGAQGSYHSCEAWLTHPVYRTPSARVELTGGFRYRELEDEFTEFDLSFEKTTAAGYLNAAAAFLIGNDSALSLDTTLTAGRLDSKEDEFSLYEDSSYALLNLSAALRVPLTQNLALTAEAEGQLASSGLDSSEHFVASGATGVNACDSSVASGDEGYLLKAGLEFRPFRATELTLGPVLTTACVYDESLNESLRLHAAGLEAGLKVHGLSLTLSAAHSLGSLPQGVTDKGQVWCSVSYAFA